MHDPHAIEMRCPSLPWVLPHIRMLVSSVASEMGFSEDDVQKIEISVDEACSNAILHGYAESERPNARISVRLRRSEEGLEIEVVDYGRGSSQGRRHSGIHNLQEYIAFERPHGLGTYIMDHLMDQVRFAFPPRSGTVVTMKKKLSA